MIVAITAAYLRKTGKAHLLPSVHWGIVFSVFSSAVMGFLILQTANGPLYEGVLGLISAVLVAGFVIHMWRTAPHLKQEMERELTQKTAGAGSAASAGVFIFTAFMITREGMETALLLIQVHSPQMISGAALGLAGAAALAYTWTRVGHLINLRIFLQVTALFLLLFIGQILIYSFHELAEAGVLPHSEAFHAATEPYSPDGIYGKWISLGMVGVCAVWLAVATVKDKLGLRRLSK